MHAHVPPGGTHLVKRYSHAGIMSRIRWYLEEGHPTANEVFAAEELPVERTCRTSLPAPACH